MRTAFPHQPRFKTQFLLLTLFPRTFPLIIPKTSGVKNLFARWPQGLTTQPTAIYAGCPVIHDACSFDKEAGVPQSMSRVKGDSRSVGASTKGGAGNGMFPEKDLPPISGKPTIRWSWKLLRKESHSEQEHTPLGNLLGALHGTGGNDCVPAKKKKRLTEREAVFASRFVFPSLEGKK
jgi:hypothetical protein